MKQAVTDDIIRGRLLEYMLLVVRVLCGDNDDMIAISTNYQKRIVFRGLSSQIIWILNLRYTLLLQNHDPLVVST